MKELKSPEELIELMKKNGIGFNIINEDVAKHFLGEHNYYFKLSAYRKNYEKVKYTDGNEKYRSLEFAYLQEISTIDMYLRYQIIKMCLDIEHSLKVNLIRHIENNPSENGYNISQIFLKQYRYIELDIINNKSKSYCEDLIDKFIKIDTETNEPHLLDIPIWVIIELISFGNLVCLYKVYDDTYKNSFRKYPLLFYVKRLRNAAAHSNCIINELYKGGDKPKGAIIQFVNKIDGIGNAMISTKLSNKSINDFITMLYIFELVVKSESIKKHRYDELFNLFDERMLKHEDYFKDNEVIKTSYKFCKKIVDKLYFEAYNNTTE